MPIIGIDSDLVSSNFVSSSLIDDSGIEAPTEHIKLLCEATIDINKFVELINISTLEQSVALYNFFDAFCINKALIKLVKARLASFTVQKKEYSMVEYFDKMELGTKTFGFNVPFNNLTFVTLFYWHGDVHKIKHKLDGIGVSHKKEIIQVNLDPSGIPVSVTIRDSYDFSDLRTCPVTKYY